MFEIVVNEVVEQIVIRLGIRPGTLRFKLTKESFRCQRDQPFAPDRLNQVLKVVYQSASAAYFSMITRAAKLTIQRRSVAVRKIKQHYAKENC